MRRWWNVNFERWKWATVMVQVQCWKGGTLRPNQLLAAVWWGTEWENHSTDCSWYAAIVNGRGCRLQCPNDISRTRLLDAMSKKRDGLGVNCTMIALQVQNTHFQTTYVALTQHVVGHLWTPRYTSLKRALTLMGSILTTEHWESQQRT